ncbi:MAG: DUF4097 family beta strand repeat-containing protein [Bacteroidota bacterium]
MNKLMITLVLILVSPFILGQTYNEIIKKELSFEKESSSNVFLLANIKGSVDVQGYDGNKVVLEAELFIRAKTNERLEKAKEQVSLGILDEYDSILVFIQGPCGAENVGVRSYDDEKSKWRYCWNNCNYSYDFKLDFKLKIPKDLNVYLSTVNDGKITVKDVNGSLDLHNVNGDISATGVKGYTYVHSVNGDIALEFDNTPQPNSSYYTLNGDIKAYLPSTFKADVTFKSFNGDIYTDFEGIEQKPMLLAKNDESKVKGTSFKVEARSVISFGGGGPRLDFETFNGDAYIKKK